MVHTHFLLYLYHLGFIHASVCIFLACGLYMIFLCVPIGYLIDAYLYIGFMSNVFCNVRGMS
jgi:hypothetical protein